MLSKKVEKRYKRGKRKNVKNVEKPLIIWGVNPDGARGKLTTIRKAIRDTGAGVWMMQETKCTQPGQLNFDGYTTYEHLREDKGGGGMALSALKKLKYVF